MISILLHLSSISLGRSKGPVPLHSSPLPTMTASDASDDEALHFLATQGFLPLMLANYDGMVEAYTRLFDLSSAYFSLPETSAQKIDFQARNPTRASEEGYSNIASEKSILTVRTLDRCPEMLREHMQSPWAITARLLEDVARSIAQSLGLRDDVFAPFIQPCCTLDQSKRTPTLLRMFRYDRPPSGAEPTLSAERHKDLGILSLVVGHSPGLQVLDPTTDRWIPIEEESTILPTRKLALEASLRLYWLARPCHSLRTGGINRAFIACCVRLRRMTGIDLVLFLPSGQLMRQYGHGSLRMKSREHLGRSRSWRVRAPRSFYALCSTRSGTSMPRGALEMKKRKGCRLRLKRWQGPVQEGTSLHHLVHLRTGNLWK